MKRFRVALTSLLGLAVVLALAACGSIPSVPGGDPCTGAGATGISDVVVDATQITVSGSVGEPCPSSIDVRAILPTGEFAADSGELVGTATVDTNGTFSVSFDRFVGTEDRGYARFLA